MESAAKLEAVRITRIHAALYGGPHTPATTVAEISQAILRFALKERRKARKEALKEAAGQFKPSGTWLTAERTVRRRILALIKEPPKK
jgi:hypothetical protein